MNHSRRGLGDPVGVESLQAARSSCPDQLDAVCVAVLASPAARKRMVA